MWHNPPMAIEELASDPGFRVCARRPPRGRRLIASCALVGVLAAGRIGHAANDARAVATAQAKTWLGLLDQGKYEDAWDTAARYLRGAVTRGEWRTQASAVREPLGKLVSRRVKSVRTATSMPGAPDGHYVVIQFASSFEHKKAAVETVTPMQEPDGSWKVAGYFIK